MTEIDRSVAPGASAVPDPRRGGRMRAARFHAAGRTLRVEDVPVPRPRHGEVLVRVMACGMPPA